MQTLAEKVKKDYTVKETKGRTSKKSYFYNNEKNTSQFLKKEELEKKKPSVEKKELDFEQGLESNVPKYVNKNQLSESNDKSHKQLNFEPLHQEDATAYENKESDILSKDEEEIFLDYKNKLKFLIQKKASENYPQASIRKQEEGEVEILFSIDQSGNIINIKIGDKTNATERLIKASKKTLELISPYERNKILEKKDTFSIIIVYRLN